MNLLLFEPDELDADNLVTIRGRRHEHLARTLKVAPGEQLRAGILGQNLGQAEVLATDAQATRLHYAARPSQPPEPMPCRLILALPRPPVLRRLMQTAAAMGIPEIYLVNSARVEKSYWQSPDLSPDKIKNNLLLGLEQAMDIHLPRVTRHQKFRPFVEDILPELARDATTYLAHPGVPEAAAPVPHKCNLLVGPEGGWVPFEIELLQSQGARLVHLGERILRVETAVPYLLGRLGLS